MKQLYLASYARDESGYDRVTVGAFPTKEMAEAAVLKHKAYAGTPEPVNYFDTYKEYLEHDDKQVRQRAMLKLTKEERELLGLKFPLGGD